MAKRRKNKHESKTKINNKRGRLIVRNLPFTVTEELLKSHFSKCGEVAEINILKKPDGKLVGCGFVQYVYKQDAAKAIHNLSGKEFNGRTIIVDWAVPKDRFIQINVKSNESVDDKTNSRDADIKISGNADIDALNKSNDHFVVYNENNDTDDEESEKSSQASLENDSVNSDDEGIDKSTKVNAVIKKPQPSHDIHEGKTIFLKNVPFSVNNEELKEFMEQFGAVHYAVVCMDPLTEHSRGTAFVKFKNEKSTQKCLSAEKLDMNGAVVEVLRALSKNAIKDKDELKFSNKKKDNRNLYLVKEGVISAGNKAAQGVSDGDMRKRLELEMWKSNMLRNLNMFVSKTRLVIHNLPSSYDDANLRDLFNKYSPKNARITEARVMKNLRNVDIQGKPISKEYGFVSFKNHEDALAALRAINNKPDIFNKMKRPIVSFSIENRVMVNAKQRRMEKSKLNNPLCPEHKKPKRINRTTRNDQVDDRIANRQRERTNEEIEDEGKNFEGYKAKQGDVKLRSKFKLKTQKELHRQNVLEEKYKMKRKKQLLEKRKEKKREAKVKPKAKKLSRNDKDFNKLVNEHKKRIMPNFGDVKKWYEAE